MIRPLGNEGINRLFQLAQSEWQIPSLVTLDWRTLMLLTGSYSLALFEWLTQLHLSTLFLGANFVMGADFPHTEGSFLINSLV